MAYFPVAVNGAGTAWLTKASGALLTDHTDFTIRFSFKRNGNPATSEALFYIGTRFAVQVNTSGRITLIGRDSAAVQVMNVITSTTSLCDNAWHHVVWSRIGTADPICAIDTVIDTISVTTNTGVAFNFGTATQAWGALVNNTAASPFTGDISDLWFKAGAGFALAAGETGFTDAAGALKDLGSSGTAESITPDVWLHRPVATWNISDGSLGNIYTLTGTFSASADAPPGVSGGVEENLSFGAILTDVAASTVPAPFYTQTKFQLFNDDGTGLGPPP